MKVWEQKQSSELWLVSAKTIFNFISLKVCKVKEQQQQISARILFCQKRNMGIIEKLKHKGFFWSAVSLSAGDFCPWLFAIKFCRMKWGVQSLTETKLMKTEHVLIFVCVSLSLSFVIAIDDNSDVCWGISSFLHTPGVKGPSFLYTDSGEAEIQFQILSLWAIIWIVLNIIQHFHG